MTDDTRKFREDLLALWQRSVDLPEVESCSAFTDFNGATYELLRELGLEYDTATEKPVFQNPSDEPCVKCGGDQHGGSLDIEAGHPCSLCGWVR